MFLKSKSILLALPTNAQLIIDSHGVGWRMVLEDIWMVGLKCTARTSGVGTWMTSRALLEPVAISQTQAFQRAEG